MVRLETCFDAITRSEEEEDDLAVPTEGAMRSKGAAAAPSPTEMPVPTEMHSPSGLKRRKEAKKAAKGDGVQPSPTEMPVPTDLPSPTSPAFRPADVVAKDTPLPVLKQDIPSTPTVSEAEGSMTARLFLH